MTTPATTGIQTPGGTFWWFNNLALVSARLLAMSTAMSGAQTQRGTLAAPVPKLIATLAGGQLQSGAMADQMQALTTAISVAQIDQGPLAVALGQMVMAMAGAQTQIGTLSVAEAQLVAATSGIEHPRGSIAAADQLLTAALLGGQAQSGSAATAMMQLTAALSGGQGDAGTIATSLMQLVAAGVAGQTQAGALAVAAQRMLTAASGFMRPEGAASGLLLPMSTTSAGGQTQAGASPAVLPAMTTSGSGAILSGIESGPLAVSAKPLLTAATGGQTQSGTMGVAMHQALTALAGTDVLVPPVIVGTPTSFSASTSDATLALPPHQVGDLILIFALAADTNTTPTPPAAGGTVPTWHDVPNCANAGANSYASRTCYAVATATNHTSGDWTAGVTGFGLIAVVVRHQNASNPFGGTAESGSTAADLMVAPAVTLSKTDGTSLLLHFFGGGGAWIASWSAAPAGYTRQAAALTNAWAGICLDTKNSTTSDGSLTQPCSTQGVVVGYRGATVEIVV